MRLRLFLLGVLVLSAGLGTTSAGPASAGQPDFTGEGASCSSGANPVRLHVAVSGLRSSDGMLTLTVYGDNPADFLASGKKLARVRVAATLGTTNLCIAVPLRRSYAIALYHDEDGDRRFTRNAIGYPVEGYGVSNDAATMMGIPSYESARFIAQPGDNRLSIAMRY
ncbi:DUF2141 domain-containing protein [Azospirillum sp. YIM B02556]|uniref:DUF2141 domain-containing protein n=1 Tax=Azospirillum endophyticum TaxID=2800326 RepID=A0ABS1FGV3_9PROT|nr:DUF2141 domain-containing protein [Azospirillum endophyticum]MBK1842663.1 DUF2141 domain-containing protein [Azospirillum endophyticum]